MNNNSAFFANGNLHGEGSEHNQVSQNDVTKLNLRRICSQCMTLVLRTPESSGPLVFVLIDPNQNSFQGINIFSKVILFATCVLNCSVVEKAKKPL